MLRVGKIPNNVLKKLILDKLSNKRSDLLVGPKIGEDCCALDFGEDICVLSTDPVTGAEKGIGRLAVHISCNDIASCGVEPIGLIITILAPPAASLDEIDRVISQMLEASMSMNVDIIGGHTEITDSVNRLVISTTAVGRTKKGRLITSSGARSGDTLVMTKTAGIEGTAIIAHDYETELSKVFDSKLIADAKSLIYKISVVREGVIASEHDVSAMHDATEGGILGAAWEMAHASGLGVDVYLEKIPVASETFEICRHFGISPYRLISSGSMLIACKQPSTLVDSLETAGIPAKAIGVFNGSGNYISHNGNKSEIIGEPDSDELYKVVREVG